MTEPRGPIDWANQQQAEREQRPRCLHPAGYLNECPCPPSCQCCTVTAAEQAVCCVCGGGPVTYRNYREQPFCWPCADCQCAQNPCVRTDANNPAAAPAQQPVRHTAETITDNDLDQLYADAERADEVIGELNEANIALARRAGRVEAALADVRGHLRYLLNYDGPGHCHLTPGRWDKDGSPCDHCARLAAARLALDTPERTR